MRETAVQREASPAPSEPGLDRLVRLAARLLEAPVAVVRAVDRAGAAAVAECGLPDACAPLADTLCARAARQGTLLLAPASELDAAWAFGVAVPLVSRDGHALGALAVFDTRPRPDFTPAAARALTDLADLAAGVLEGRPGVPAQRGTPAWDGLWDRLKALAVEAPDYEAAAAATTRALCEAAGGLLCTLHRLGADGRHLQLIGGHADQAIGGAARLDAIRAAHLSSADPVIGAAVDGTRAVFAEDSGPGDPARHRLFADIAACPLVLGAMPFRIAEERCVILLCCAAPAAHLPALLRDAAATLRPLLQMLRDEERTLLHRRVVEASSEAVLITEAAPDDTRIVHVNPAFEALTGFTAADLVGRTPRLLQGLGAPGEGWRAIRDAVRRRRPLRQTVRYHRKDGVPLWVDLHISPVTDAVGRCTHFVSMLRDVTREHEAAERLAESEAAFRSLFERNPIPMWIYDQETLAFLSVNDAAVERYGWSREDFLRMTILDIRPLEEAGRAREKAIEARATGERLSTGPWRHRTADGGEKQVQIVSTGTRFGSRAARLVAAWDITARLRFEQDLRHSRAALQRQAVDLRRTQRLARLGTWRWHVAGDGVAWSEEVHAIFGTDPDGPPPTREATLALLHPEDRPGFEAAIERIAATGTPAAFDFRIERRDGRTVHCRAEGHWEPDPAEGEPAVHGYLQDVTEQREAEAALRQSDRLASLGQLTGGIAHDFNNLLTVASVSLEMAAEAAVEGRTSPELIESARGALERGMRLTSQLLSYARKQPLRPQALDLDRVLPALLDMMARSLGERYPIRLAGPRAQAVSADPAGLEAALLNLLVNARDAMPAGGPITVETGLLTVTPGTTEGDLAPGGYVTIAVTDAGSGMPAEIRARIFEPFFTTKPAGRGTGLGLSMVLGFAKQSGGHVEVESEPGRGTTMRLVLPAVLGAVEPPARQEQPAPPMPEGLDVLVVEDQPDVREAAVRLCREVGLQPVAVPNATEALQVMASGLRFDLLFTDVVLGGEMDGLELAETAVHLHPGVAVICTSGYTEGSLGRRGHMPPGVELLPKPYDMRRFRAAAARALAAARTP